ILKHRVRGITEQRNAAGCPAFHWFAIAQNPHAPCLDALEHAQHLRHLHLEVLPHDVLAAFGIPAFLIVIGVEYRGQLVMYEMGARTGPQDDVGAPKILWHILALENAAVGDVSRHPRLAVSDDTLADL